MIKKFITSVLFTALISVCACSSDDDNSGDKLMGENNLTIEFDNSFKGDDLLLGTSAYTNSNGEVLTISRFNYLVSNFVLIDAEGNEFVYPKDDSYFVISEENGMTQVTLSNIPAGKYTALRFGIGVDQQKYLQGADGQNDDFLKTAEDNAMMWTWQAGYKFLNFEGSFTSATVTQATDFKIHMGSHGTALDNYREVEILMPTEALVSSTLSPVVHLIVDANKVLDGTFKIKLSEEAVVMVDEVKSPQIAENAMQMFRVDHVHNGENVDH